MSDRFGVLPLPVPAVIPPLFDTPPLDSVGDPALEVVARYLASAINADCGVAWSNLVRGQEDKGLGVGPVRRIYLNEFKEQSFLADHLPALCVWRTSPQGGASERATTNSIQITSQFWVVWIAPLARQENDFKRTNFDHAIRASFVAAIRNARHPAFVVPSDRADPAALALAFATSTSPTTISGALLNGPKVSVAVDVARPVRITASKVTGAYSTAPMTVTGVDGRGRVVVDTASFSSVNGGVHAHTIWRYARVNAVDLPGMGSTAGRLQIGYADSPEVKLGSPYQRYAGFGAPPVITNAGEAKRQRPNPAGRLESNPQLPEFDTLEMSFTAVEYLDLDPTVHADPNIEGESHLFREDGVEIDTGDIL